jgi:acyl-CoA thioesterase-1
LTGPGVEYRRMSRNCFAISAALLAFCLNADSTFAQTKKPASRGAKKPNPVYAPIKDKPGLPRVLLIGDSISVGYTLPTRQRLKGKANVHRIPVNGGPTTRGLENLDAWLGDKQWDVIHFNWGLHDLKYMAANKTGNLANPNAAGSRQQVPPADYESNLRQLVKRLKQTDAKLIWCATTPVPKGSQGRLVADAIQYNAIAAKVMKEEGVAINDLYAHALKKQKALQRTANVHFSLQGSQYLAEQIAAEIKAKLPPAKR